MSEITVLVADDHPAFREGLCRILDDESDIKVVARAANGEEAVSLAKSVKPDIAIIDVSMPCVDGIEAAKQIKEGCPSTAILMISAYDYESYVLASLRLGAAGYLLKDAALPDLVNAVRMVHSGDAVFDRKATADILARLSAIDSHSQRNRSKLGDREFQVLKLAARGMSNKQIGETLAISGRTVQTHLVRVFKKLGVSSRTEAVRQALKDGWLTINDLS